MLIEANNMYEAWIRLNEEFMVLPTSEGMHIPNRDYTRIVWPVRLHICCGFGFNAEVDGYDWLPRFYMDYPRRIKLLANRYIDSDLWEEGIVRLKARERRFQLKNPLSFVIQFHRRRTQERKVPAGGGCMTQVTFVWIDGRWALHVSLRASEVTAALIGDIAFVEWITRRVREEVRMKNWDEGNLEIIWDIALASQMKSITPLFLLFTGGDENVWHNLFKDTRGLNEWHASVINHFWDTFIYPEKITWHRRQKWSNRFLELTEIDWRNAKEKWKKEYEL